MDRKFIVLAMALLIAGTLVAFNGKAQGSGNPPPASSKSELTNKDILGMAKAGLSQDVILAKIQTSECAFDTSPAMLIELKSAGVPESVILAMVKCSPSNNYQGHPTGIIPEGKLETSQQKEATSNTPKPQVTDEGTGPGEGGGLGGGAYSVGNGVSEPVPIFKPDPAYSEEARKAKYQGTVVLWVVVDASGVVTDCRVVKPLGLGLDEKAIETVRTWRFKPAQRNGTPVPVRVMVQVSFRLFTSQRLTPQRLFLSGSARDVKMLKNSLQPWAVGPGPCVQFIDRPEPGAYTLKFRWENHYTVFVHSGTEADMDLYDSKGTLLWSEHNSVRAAGAYHEGHPEKEMYPKLYKALGCSTGEQTQTPTQPVGGGIGSSDL